MKKPLIFLLMITFMMHALPALAEEAQATEAAATAEASEIMGHALDGSSVDAFEAGLDKVKEEATEDEYTTLRKSVGMMLAYDVSVSYSKSKLYQKLDGMTPTQIITQSEAYKRR